MNICIVEPIESVSKALSRITSFKTPYIKLPIMEDPTIVAGADVKSWGEMVPGLSDLIDVVSAGEQTMTGFASKLGQSLMTKLNSKMWTPSAAKPWEISIRLGFFSEVQTEKPLNSVSGLLSSAVTTLYSGGAKTDFQAGHWIHTLNNFISLSILSFNPDGKIAVPACSIKDVSQISTSIKAVQAKYSSNASFSVPGMLGAPKLDFNSKIVHLLIPGVIDIPLALLAQASVTYSKHNTELGYPLWATVDANFIGLLPAMGEDLVAGAQLGKQMMGTTNIMGTIGNLLG